MQGVVGHEEDDTVPHAPSQEVCPAPDYSELCPTFTSKTDKADDCTPRAYCHTGPTPTSKTERALGLEECCPGEL